MKFAGTYKITRQGQITLPAEARENINLHEGDVVEMFYGDDLVLVKKKKTPLEIFEELSQRTTSRFRENKITPEVLRREIELVRKHK